MPAQPKISDAASSVVRPKVLRRPAHFSAATPVAAPLEIPAGAAVTSPAPAAAPATIPAEKSGLPAPVAPHARAWQDDGAFGLFLLLVLAVVNVALALLLPQLQQPPTAGGEPRIALPWNAR